ncbi:translational GTPase TypA, partial [Bacillus thuringiensis]|nr:translational GTPase TypA [Bacillus thuringiensis]
ASADQPEALPLLKIDPPTLQMDFDANDSPFAGREGDQVTPKKLEDRLIRQTRTDVSLKVEPTDQINEWTVSGRGELHLSILVEELRREGFKLQLSHPKVIYRGIDGTMCEPFEAVQIDTPDEYVGSVIDSLSQRKGEMKNMESTGNGQTRLEFLVPSRVLIGYNNEFMSQTCGYGIMNHTFDSYKPVVKNWNPGRRNGALVSINQGQSTTYS